MDLAEYRKLSHDTWQRMAAGWDEWNARLVEASGAVTADMVAALAPEPGETILELAGGVGVSGLSAAALMQGEGRVIMTDFAENMVEAQRRRGEELGLTNAEYRTMDAERMELPDHSVDGVLCRWGYMLMSDSAAALRETRRVLRPGGRLSFSVWGAPADNPWASLPGRVLIERGHMQPPESGAPGIFAMADPSRIEELVTGAGFERPELREVPMMYRFEDFDIVWQYITRLVGAISLVISQLDSREVENVRSETETALSDFAGEDGYRIPGVCINGLVY